MTAIRATCNTDGCRTVMGFTFAMDPPEAKRMQRKVLAVAGWLVLPQDATYCPECHRMLKIALPRMEPHQRRTVQNALADALAYGRMEVAGV